MNNCSNEQSNAEVNLKIEAARRGELSTSRLLAVSDIFKVLADPTRIRMLQALSVSGELCVGDLSTVLEMSPSAISHQLALLRRSHLVRYRREGKVVFYALDDEHVERLLEMAIEHVAEAMRDALQEEARQGEALQS
ncbi:MAG: metalloregulator ArsR/SmtB family transcription factor [Spirochaetales bacterium]